MFNVKYYIYKNIVNCEYPKNGIFAKNMPKIFEFRRSFNVMNQKRN